MIGIYKITNNETGRCYIGKGVNIDKRLDDHVGKLVRGTHFNKNLQAAFDECGKDISKFEFSVVKKCENFMLDYWESKYIQENVHSCYNIKNEFFEDTEEHLMEVKRVIDTEGAYYTYSYKDQCGKLKLKQSSKNEHDECWSNMRDNSKEYIKELMTNRKHVIIEHATIYSYASEVKLNSTINNKDCIFINIGDNK